MTRTQTNVLVDSIAFLLLIALASTGLLMEFVLPAHSRDLAVWGMTRHDWGEIHLWIGYGFLAALTVHFLLHASWIMATILGKPSKRNRARLVAVIAGLMVFLAIAISPFFAPVGGGESGSGEKLEQQDGRRGEGRSPGWQRRH